MSLCGHTSISALFRFEVLNYFSITVELRITYLLAIGRTNESARKSHIDKRPILPTLSLTAVVPLVSWSVMVHAGICQHGRARSSAISR